MLIPFPFLNRSKMRGWVSSRLVGFPEVIVGGDDEALVREKFGATTR